MIVWRGWGFLAAVYIALAMMLFAGLASTLVPETGLPFTISLGLLLAAVATWFTGQAVNVRRPQRKIDAWARARRAQLDELVARERFVPTPGTPLPSSRAEAQAQSDDMFAREQVAAARSRNVHTLFFVPMQFWAFLIAAVAVVVLAMGIAGLLGA